MIIGIFFLFGLTIGSFLNVVLVRTEKEESLTGRSHCPKCGALIHWYDNIPLLSYLLLRGECRQCRTSIHWQYPAVELATGALFALSGSLVFDIAEPTTWGKAIFWCFLFSILLIITVYDLRHMEIPLNFLLFGIGGALFYFALMSFIMPGEAWWQSPIASAILGGGLAASFFYALVYFSHERWMGMGDVWLSFLSGMAVGPGLVFLLLVVSFCLGAMVAVGLLILKRKELSSQVPFAPYLALATLFLLLLSVSGQTWLSLFLFPVV